MPSTFFFIAATLFLSLNLVRPFGLAISDWLYFGALGFAFLETFTVDRRQAPCWWRNRLLFAVALILFGAVISTMNSWNWGVAVVEIIQHAFVMTLFISLIWIMVRRGEVTPIVIAFILSGIFTASIVLVDYLTGSSFGPTLSGTPDIQNWGRYVGTLGHPNKLGFFLVLTTLLSLGHLFSFKTNYALSLYRLIGGVLIIVQVFGIYLSGSLTAYLGLLLGVLILAVCSKSNVLKATTTLVLVTGVSILVIMVVIIINRGLLDVGPNFESNPILQAINRVQMITAESRLTVFGQAWDQIVKNPWFGVGYDQLSTTGVNPAPGEPSLDVHNSLLQIWYAGGLFAFLGWLSIYILISWMAIIVIQEYKQNKLPTQILSLAAATGAILLMDQFQDGIYQREKWLVIGLFICVFWEQTRIERVSNIKGITLRENRPMDPQF